MFYHLTALVAIPALILASLPLLPLALATSFLAFVALAARAAAVYAELGLALLKRTVAPAQPSDYYVTANYSLRPPATAPALLPAAASSSSSSSSSSRHHSAATRPPLYSAYSSSGSLAPRRRPSAGSLAYFPPMGLSGGAGSLERDFEGVGGWRIDHGNNAGGDSEYPWNLNSRLELPAAGARTPGGGISPGYGYSYGYGYGAGYTERGGYGRKRSWTSSAVRLDRSSSSRPKSASQGGSRVGSIGGGELEGLASGQLSPEEGLTMAKKTRSMLEVGMGLGKPQGGRQRRKSGSSGSISSGNSQRTMTATAGTGWMAP